MNNHSDYSLLISHFLFLIPNELEKYSTFHRKTKRHPVWQLPHTPL